MNIIWEYCSDGGWALKKKSSDLLFILVDNNNMYLIPRSEITNNAAINLGKEYDRYKVYL